MGATVSSDRALSLLQTLLAVESIPRVPVSLEPLVDATERCVVRYGVARVSMSDLAREMNIARTTLYRQVDSIDKALFLLACRILHQIVDDARTGVIGGPDPRANLIDATVRSVNLAANQPFIRRLLDHEPEFLGELFSTGLCVEIVHRLTDVCTPLMEGALASGQIHGDDPRLVAELFVRTAVGLVILPTDRDLRTMIEFAYAPILVPAN
jgi:AcrR family transcriptional regulator